MNSKRSGCLPALLALRSEFCENTTITIVTDWAMVDKPDPFEIEPLETALNDSATRVSAIWISFLIFSLYLLVAATTVTQHQLLLAQPVQLPVLNIGLPLWGFFFLAPILFVTLHTYVLLQVLLLGRTAAAYDAAVARLNLSADENNSLRQRLANTLFAQIFAGSPRERQGFIGLLLTAMVWITLVVLPISVLLTFQFSFLAYHSHPVTWTHRLLIFIELAAFILLWPVALDGKRDFRFPNPVAHLKNFVALPWRLFAPQKRRRDELLWLRGQAVPLAALLLFIVVSLWFASFPGEPHVNIFTLNSPSSVQCKRFLHQRFKYADLRFDRLVLPFTEVVDSGKLPKNDMDNPQISRSPIQQVERPWTQNFQDRNLECSDLHASDLRGVKLLGANLQGANLQHADLRDASLSLAQLQGATLISAHLEGELMDSADLSGANLRDALLQGANLTKATFNVADLAGASLQGALLDESKLQGAILDSAKLQGAHLKDAHLEHASLRSAQLQGALLGTLDEADLSGAWVWRTSISICPKARLSDIKLIPIIQNVSASDGSNLQPISATDPDAVKKFITASTSMIQDDRDRSATARRMSKALAVDQNDSETDKMAKVWSDCEAQMAIMLPEQQMRLDAAHAAQLLSLACNLASYDPEVVAGIINTWIVNSPSSSFSVQLARGLLSADGSQCGATKYLSSETRRKLTEIIAAAAPSTPTASSPGSAPKNPPGGANPASEKPPPARVSGSAPGAFAAPTSGAASAANR
jgi:uncharacterized protein YjbI with pentapeptide repeats